MTALLITGLTFSAAAQNLWLTGNFRLAGTSNATSESTLTFMPEVGYLLDGPWAIGGQFGFESQWNTNVQGETRRESRTAIVPFVRYFLGEQASLNFFMQGELPLNFYGGEHYNGTSMESTTSVGFAMRPGLFYAINDNWGLTVQMPSIFRIEDHEGITSYELILNQGYTLQRYFLNTSWGITYTF